MALVPGKLLPLWLMERGTDMGHFFATRLGLQLQHYPRCFYVWPPVEGYWSHTSTTCSEPNKPRPLKNHFVHPWITQSSPIQAISRDVIPRGAA